MTRCKQLDSLLQERGEEICPLEADHDQVGLVGLCEVERVSAVDGCTRSLGGMEAPEPLVAVQIPSANVPVCVVTGVVSKCVFNSVAKCVLQCANSVGERLCVKETARVKETPSVSNMVCVGEKECLSERPCVRKTACVREKVCVDETPCVGERVCVRETACMRESGMRGK